MRSIRTKLITLMVVCILASVSVITVVSAMNSNKVVNSSSAQIINLNCENAAQEINALLSRIDQSVTTLSTYLLEELDDVGTFQTDAEYVEEYTSRIKTTVLNAADHTEGALTVYVRYNPEFTEPTSGLFCTRATEDSSFDLLTPTDFSSYDPSDTAHVGWYYVPVQNGKPTWMAPYVNENLGINMISYVIPLTKDGVSIGIVGMDIDFGRISGIVDETKAYNSGYAYLVNDQQQIVYHKELELYTNLADVNGGELAGLAEHMKSGGGETAYAYTYGGRKQQMVFHTLDNGMQMALTAPTDEIQADANTLLRQMVTLSLVAVVGAVCISLVVIQRMVKPIRALSGAAKRVGEGDLDVTIDYRSKDEIGTLALNFGKAVQRLREYVDYIKEVSATLDEMADGNLSFQLKQAYVGEFATLKAALEKVSRLLSQTLSQIHEVSNFVASSSQQVSSGAQALSQGASEQAAYIGELSDTIGSITVQMRESAENARTASGLSGEAGADITDSNRRMQEMMTAMGEINRMSGEIEKIVKTIDDIAMQTNILALNAAVEAARAGVAGKGFAVVADEVRNLAGKSAEAVKDTTALIERTKQAIENGTRLADSTAAALESTVGKVSSVNGKIVEIASATDRQQEAVAQVEKGVQQISAVVHTNSAAAEESAATSEELSGQAQSLNQLISRFKLRKDTDQ